MEENASRVLLLCRLCMITRMAVNHPFSSAYNLFVCVRASVYVGGEKDCNSHDLDTRWYRAKVANICVNTGTSPLNRKKILFTVNLFSFLPKFRLGVRNCAA